MVGWNASLTSVLLCWCNSWFCLLLVKRWFFRILWEPSNHLWVWLRLNRSDSSISESSLARWLNCINMRRVWIPTEHIFKLLSALLLNWVKWTIWFILLQEVRACLRKRIWFVYRWAHWFWLPLALCKLIVVFILLYILGLKLLPPALISAVNINLKDFKVVIIGRWSHLIKLRWHLLINSRLIDISKTVEVLNLRMLEDLDFLSICTFWRNHFARPNI